MISIEGLTPRKDIVYVPHIYDIGWAVTTNNFLKEMFYCPVEFEYDSYLPGRSLEHKYLAELFPRMRKDAKEKVFFFNALEDFTQDIIKAGFAKKLYGLLHGTNFSEVEYGGNKKLQDFERSIMGMFKKIFVGSEMMRLTVPYETEILGIPIFQEPLTPSESSGIIYNHRLAKNKNPQFLLDLPKAIQDRVVISTPKATLQYFPLYKPVFKDRFHFQPKREKYMELLHGSGIGLSFATNDTFGVSVVEGIMSGLFYLCPVNDTTSYKYIIHKEMLFSSFEECVYKIEYYSEHINERKEIVREAQKMLEPYYYKNWYNSLIEKI
jgi:hypothetical protein